MKVAEGEILVLDPGHPAIPSAPGVLRDERGEVWKRLTGEKGGVLLVRPDGYVGFYSEGYTLDGLSAFLGRLFLLAPNSPGRIEKAAIPKTGDIHSGLVCYIFATL